MTWGNIIKTAALALAPLVLGGHAVWAENEPKLITLSCDGTLTHTAVSSQAKPVEKMGVAANLSERTVSFQGWVAPIVNVDAAGINFDGKPVNGVEGFNQRIDGYLDRVTGHMIADTTTYGAANPITDHYDVLCKATDRVF